MTTGLAALHLGLLHCTCWYRAGGKPRAALKYPGATTAALKHFEATTAVFTSVASLQDVQHFSQKACSDILQCMQMLQTKPLALQMSMTFALYWCD